MKKYLILSPFATNGTQNSGDDLIVQSLINLLNALSKEDLEFDVVSIAKSTLTKETTFNNTNLDNYVALLCPGFRVSIKGQESLTTRLKYIEKALMKKMPVFLIGSSWCIFPGIEYQTTYKIEPKEKALLNYVLNDENSYLSARDLYTAKLLENNNIVCDMTGDLGFFDINKMHNDFVFDGLNTVAISMPHNTHYYKYCKNLKFKLEEKFNCKVYLCTHQYLPNNKSYKNLYGAASNLNFYNSVDLHIGFRLHGHLYFLRNRKPTLLIAEDGRSYGHLNTFDDFGIHATPTYILKKYEKVEQFKSNLLKDLSENSRVNVNGIINMISKGIENDFSISKKTIKKIDNLWDNITEKAIMKILEA